jgi:hypothetical protein
MLRLKDTWKYVNCRETPWSREFFRVADVGSSYAFCNVVEYWIDSKGNLEACLAVSPTGEEFFALPRMGHFGRCNVHHLQCRLF